MKITEENILNEAEKGNLETLNHPLVDKVKNNYGWTPLHRLARREKIEVLNHPSVDKVKDTWGRTPLHRLAEMGKVTKEILKERYPWFKIKNQKINKELISEILNTPNSVRFIKGL